MSLKYKVLHNFSDVLGPVIPSLTIVNECLVKDELNWR